MTNGSVTEMVRGIFQNEEKNRFLCTVIIDGISTLCYVPSSCRLESLITLSGKEVLLIPTSAPKARTRYALFAVAHKRNYIILNSSYANTIVAANIHKRHFSSLGGRSNILREYTINGYKCDIFIPSTKTIIEVKSIISESTIAIFPSVFSRRALEQLNAIKLHLLLGNPACYVIVALNPYIKSIALDTKAPFYSSFKECLDLGMKVLGATSYVAENGIMLRKLPKIELVGRNV